MPVCILCRTDVGFIGSFSFNKITGRCNRCESETRIALMHFRAAFLSFCSDGILTRDKWKRLLAGATSERLNLNEAVAFIYLDALNLLNRLLTFAAANGSITDEDERNFHYMRMTLAIPDSSAQPLVARLHQLKYITNIRRGNLPTVHASIRLDTDEICHLEIPATFHKVNAKSVSQVQGRFVVTSKKLRFLSVSGGTEIGWNTVMRIEMQSSGIYLELSRKAGNGFYSVHDPLLIEAVIDTLTRIAKRQLVGTRTDDNSRHIPQDVRIAVWQRDQGKCVQCSADSYLEFDHIIPFSKGGANTLNNVQLLCRKCNLQKGDRI